MTTKTITYAIMTLIATMMITGAYPVFAVESSSTGPWSPNESKLYTSTGDEYADAQGTGNSKLYTLVTGTFEQAKAEVRNNWEWVGTASVGSSPKLDDYSDSANPWFEVTAEYSADITADAPAGEAAFWIGGAVFRDGAIQFTYGNDEKVGGAGSHTHPTGGHKSLVYISHSGTHDYQMGGTHWAESATNFWSGTNEVDLKNNGNYIKTTKLRIFN